MWLMGATVAVVHELSVLRKGLKLDRYPGGEPLSGLGAANWITLARGFMVAWVAGFILAPPNLLKRGDYLSWFPGILFILECLLDSFDGKIARRKGTTTKLGAYLDMEFDALAILVGSLLVVRWGQAPSWYASVGAAYFLFSAGRWLRKKTGMPVHPLPASTTRRWLAGLTMTVTGGLLLPLLEPPITTLMAVATGLPFLANFVRDWFFLCRGSRWKIFIF
jgi:CDP-diacylglycerol--glycerol-3-phosphate 3-phosphatidyltransferase